MNIIQELEDSQITLSDESKKSFKDFEKSLEQRRFKKILQTKLAQYNAGEETLQQVRESNFEWKKKEDAKRRRRNDTTIFKIQDNKDESKEGRINIFSYQRNKYVTVRFQNQIKEELFTSSIVEYAFKGQKICLLIPSFFNVLQASYDMGIPRDRLGYVFNLYTKLCLPNLHGQLNTEASCLIGNLDKLLEVISIKGERKKMETQLNSVIRNPGQKLEEYLHMLFTLYNSFCTLEHLIDEKETQDTINYIIHDPG